MNAMNPTPSDDVTTARALAFRYRCKFVDLRDFQLKSELLKKVPVDLMLRYKFVPLAEMQDGRLAIAVADPSQLRLFDEVSLLLGKQIVIQVATPGQINNILNADPSHDEPPGPHGPDAPVGAPLKPKPHLRSGSARAVPEHGQ